LGLPLAFAACVPSQISFAASQPVSAVVFATRKRQAHPRTMPPSWRWPDIGLDARQPRAAAGPAEGSWVSLFRARACQSLRMGLDRRLRHASRPRASPGTTLVLPRWFFPAPGLRRAGFGKRAGSSPRTRIARRHPASPPRVLAAAERPWRPARGRRASIREVMAALRPRRPVLRADAVV